MTNNFFDNIELNIPEVKNDVLKNKIKYSRSIFPKLDLICNIFVHLSGMSKEFIYSYLFTKWFEEFNIFWTKILKGRPIDIIDFHFLRELYRVKFQSVRNINESNSINFLKAWNSKESLYLLFSNIWNYAKSGYLNFLPFYSKLPSKGKVLEYGCGIAPFTTGMLKYFPSKKFDYEISDILQINFLYAIFRLSNQKNVKYRILKPFNNIVEKNNYSVIICQTVLEHIPNPLKVVKSFFNGLGDNGVLVFDYIKGEAEGLDSKKSVQERKKTLEYIKNNFTLIKGKIEIENSVGLCVVKKRNNLSPLSS